MKLEELLVILSKKTESNVNQSLLAESLGITRQTISNRIKNSSQVTVSELKKLKIFLEYLYSMILLILMPMLYTLITIQTSLQAAAMVILYSLMKKSNCPYQQCSLEVFQEKKLIQ